jgi:hypothetical protein
VGGSGSAAARGAMAPARSTTRARRRITLSPGHNRHEEEEEPGREQTHRAERGNLLPPIFQGPRRARRRHRPCRSERQPEEQDSTEQAGQQEGSRFRSRRSGRAEPGLLSRRSRCWSRRGLDLSLFGLLQRRAPRRTQTLRPEPRLPRARSSRAPPGRELGRRRARRHDCHRRRWRDGLGRRRWWRGWRRRLRRRLRGRRRRRKRRGVGFRRAGGCTGEGKGEQQADGG